MEHIVYGIKRGISGVYYIKNKLNGKVYIGSSKDISSRLSTHFGRDCKNNHTNQDRPLYGDIYKYGRDNFEWGILELCEPCDLIELEKKWYDKINPEYNFIRPNKCSFVDVKVNKKVHLVQSLNGLHKRRKELYNTNEYKLLFREIQRYKFKSVRLIELNLVFESLSSASRWVGENTSYTGKNKTSKIKSVCDGERKLAYGYHWEYCENL